MMTGILSLAAVLAAQGAVSVPGPDVQITEQKEVAYEALASGDADQAVSELESRLEADPQDPALLINLGSAYAGQGKLDRAGAAYRAAIDSPIRYDLELADGTWADSRHAARRALRALDGDTGMAMR